MTYDFSGKTAVVTGASRGIGKGIALELARNGADIVGVYVKNEEKAKEALDEIIRTGVNVEFVKCDVSKEKDVQQLKDRVLDKYGKADLIINNAGIHQHLKSWELSLEDWNRVIQTNLTGVFLVTKAFIPIMKEKRSGRVVNISSCVAYSGTDHEVHYAASKSGIVGLTKSLALELATYGINVNAVAPGYISTDMLAFDSVEEEKGAIQTIPMGRIGLPEDIARSVAFLCSDGAGYMTGQVLHVNGGLIMY